MKVIDLSLPIFEGMEVYPGDPETEIREIHTLENEGWRLKLLKMGSHTGTHIDSFSHMDKNGKTLDEIPIERFFGRAMIVDINAKFPEKIGMIFTKGKLGTKYFGKVFAAKPPFIGVSSECKFEVELERKLLQNEILTFGPLSNVDRLPKDKEFMFYGFPLKIKDGDGSPIRAVAIID